MNQKVKWDKGELQRLYWGENLTGSELARQYAVSPATVWRALGRLGIPRRTGKREEHPRWKGGIHTKRDKRRYIKLQPDNPFYPMADKHTGYAREHRLVVARHLNRCLLPWEIVHHKNGIADDNRLENLELLPSRKYHIPSMKMQQIINKLQKRIEILEAENQFLYLQLLGVHHS